jgi:hypothetical protein
MSDDHLERPPLYLVHGNRFIELAGAAGVIGRTPGDNVQVVTDPTVSSRHLEWERRRWNQVAVRDCGSSAGSLAGGQLVGKEWLLLRVGATIKLGRSGPWRLGDEPPVVRTEAAGETVLVLSSSPARGAEAEVRAGGRAIRSAGATVARFLLALGRAAEEQREVSPDERGWLPVQAIHDQVWPELDWDARRMRVQRSRIRNDFLQRSGLPDLLEHDERRGATRLRLDRVPVLLLECAEGGGVRERRLP